MSDLIDFDSPNGPSLASPLIPLPASSKNNLNEAGPRRSMENNPFDMVMKKACDYERNKEDPFERVIEKAMGRVSIETKDDFIPKRRRYSDILKMNKSLDEAHEMSIIVDLNDTHLIGDSSDIKPIIDSWKIVPEVNISPMADLSILNNSAMNDSLLDNEDLTRPRSMSQSNFLVPKRPSPKNRRSMSVTDTLKKSTFSEDISTQSSVFDDPLNNAFRQFSLRSNYSDLSSQFDLSVSKQRIERLNSDSSVFSGLSNISAIPIESSTKMRNERFCSESSMFSGISNLSIIPPNNGSSSCDSSVFSNDTINKGFVASRSQLSSTSSARTDNADLIKKFFEIKTRMSTSHVKHENEESNSNQKLIDIGNTTETSNNVTGVNDIISNEAKALADTFEKMATSKVSNSTTEEDLLFSRTQLNFDDLPPSDDETVDNLIELPNSPVKDSPLQKSDIIIKEEPSNSVSMSPKDDIKALESEFVENQDSNKKAMAATLLLDLEKLIKQDSNPDAQKVLRDLQKLLGVHCDNNTEILQVCLQGSPQDEKKSEIQNENNKSDDQCSDNVNKLSNSKEVTDNRETEVVNVKEEKPTELNEEQNLAINLLKSLNKIVTQKAGESAIDVLLSLGTVLNMATELKTKKNDRRSVTPKSTSRLHNRSINSLHKSPSSKNHGIKTQNKSFDNTAIRKSLSISTSNSTNNLMDLHMAKDKRKLHLINLKKRFPSDPGFVESTLNKNKAEVPNTITHQSSLTKNKNTSEPVKTKLKKKTGTEAVTKKGPLKAMIPLGSMQKKDSVKMSAMNGIVTPPKVPSINITSSTPNSNEGRNSKSKPAASSTPNMDGLKTNRKKYNMSPASMSSSMKVNLSSSRNSSRRSDRTLSPQKRPSTPRKSSESVENSRLPRYSPRPVRVRNYSFNDLKTAKSPQSTSGVTKISSEKKIQQRNSVLSPLENCNKFTYKTKPLSLTSRLSKSGTIQTGPEKENYS